MRILIYGLNFYPEIVGVGKYTHELATYLGINNEVKRFQESLEFSLIPKDKDDERNVR